MPLELDYDLFYLTESHKPPTEIVVHDGSGVYGDVTYELRAEGGGVMSDIELHERYPLSRREDITDAYMRGVEVGRKIGRGTCTMAHDDGNDTWWSCNECDADVYLPTKPKFCWNCGREVVDG